MPKSGIITTILGKHTAFIGIAGRERRIHHSKSLPLPLTGERFFFASEITLLVSIKPYKNR
jgi:hypothetical protein